MALKDNWKHLAKCMHALTGLEVMWAVQKHVRACLKITLSADC